MTQEFTMESLTKENFQEKELELCRKIGRPVALMPTGQFALSSLNYWKDNSIEIAFFVDNDSSKHGTNVDGIPVLSFEQYHSKAEEVFLVILCWEEISKLLVEQLKLSKVESSNYCLAEFDDFHFIEYTGKENNAIRSTRKTIEQNIEQFNIVFNLLGDTLSQQTLINVLNYRLTCNPRYLGLIQQPPEKQYLEPDIRPISADDYFVDCGAYNGDTLESVMSVTNKSISGYYAFEPDEYVFNDLLDKCNNINNIFLFPNGVYKEDAILHFTLRSHGGTSIGKNGGGGCVRCFALDSVLGQQPVTVIKMDLEGGEYDALVGARNVVQSQQPFLAICVYHRLTDYFTLPLLIESFGVKYNYYMRHYSDKWRETVLYAVPIQ